MSKYAEQEKTRVAEVRKTVAFEIYNSIVKKTPVDTGRARGNWDISVGADKTDADMNATSPKYKSADEVATPNGDEVIYIMNNLPYICTLEYGGYPDPVKKGTWDRKQHRYVIKSSGGYSKQAPHGMVGVTMANAKRIVDMAIKAVYGNDSN